MSNYSWTCPFCNRDATIRDYTDITFFSKELGIENSEGERLIRGHFIVCPNKECRKFTLTVYLRAGSQDKQGNTVFEKTLKAWNLIPQSFAKVFPDYIPKVIREDYEEACAIVDLSPKASATLARRCLQGILRDFWKVKPGWLSDEIDEIKDKVDGDVWDAIDAVRNVGNIGAHMEKDINLIIDVETGEAKKLIGLIEMLMEEWYINKQKRQSRLEEVKHIAKTKDEKRSVKKSEDTSIPHLE